MLDDLKFVQGAVAKKDIVPQLTHFRIKNGTIRGYNGKIALCSPIQLNIDCQPRAVPFIKAIEASRDTVQLSLTPTKRLSVKSGPFKALILCDEGDFPEVEPEGDMIQLNGSLLQALKVLEPLIAEDASRPWARGILFRGYSAYATNNVVLAEYWLGYQFPFDMNIPHDAVNELLRIKCEPIAMQVSKNSVTFHFENGRWLRTQTYSTEWPDIEKVLNREIAPAEAPQNFFGALTDLVPFVEKENRVYFLGDKIATATTDGDGASLEVPGIPQEGCFNIKMLRLIEDIATQFDFQYLPRGPVMFFGNNVRGAIMGMRPA